MAPVVQKLTTNTLPCRVKNLVALLANLEAILSFIHFHFCKGEILTPRGRPMCLQICPGRTHFHGSSKAHYGLGSLEAQMTSDLATLILPPMKLHNRLQMVVAFS